MFLKLHTICYFDLKVVVNVLIILLIFLNSVFSLLRSYFAVLQMSNIKSTKILLIPKKFMEFSMERCRSAK